MDAIDRAIIEELRQDGRLSNQDLAARVGLTPAPCLRRVRRLEESGVITGYTVLVNEAALGRGTEVLVHVNLTVNDTAAVEAFEARMVAMPEIVELRRMFGVPDYLIRVRVAGLEEYEQWAMNRLLGDPAISRADSRITMKVLKSLS